MAKVGAPICPEYTSCEPLLEEVAAHANPLSGGACSEEKGAPKIPDEYSSEPSSGAKSVETNSKNKSRTLWKSDQRDSLLHFQAGDTLRVRHSDGGFTSVARITEATETEVKILFNPKYAYLLEKEYTGMQSYTHAQATFLIDGEGWECLRPSYELGRTTFHPVQTYGEEREIQADKIARKEEKKKTLKEIEKRLKDPIERIKMQFEGQLGDVFEELQSLELEYVAWEEESRLVYWQGEGWSLEMDKWYFDDPLQYLNLFNEDALMNPHVNLEESLEGRTAKKRREYLGRIKHLRTQLQGLQEVHQRFEREGAQALVNDDPKNVLSTEHQHLVVLGLAERKEEQLDVKINTARNLREKGNYEEALAMASGAYLSYASISVPGIGSVLLGADGQPSLTSRLNKLMEDGVIDGDTPIHTAADIDLENWWKDSLRFYPASQYPSAALIDYGKTPPITREEIEQEIRRLEVIEIVNGDALGRAKAIRTEMESLRPWVTLSKGLKMVNAFGEGAKEILFDPSTAAMIAAGIIIRPMSEYFFEEAIYAGFSRLSAGMLRLAASGISFHTVTNTMNYALDPRMIDWSPQAFWGSIQTFGVLHGVNFMYGKFAQATFLRAAESRPVLTKMLYHSGAFGAEVTGLTASSVLPKIMDPDYKFTRGELLADIKHSVQMALAFRAYHLAQAKPEMKQKGLYDKASKRALENLQKQANEYGRNPSATNHEILQEAIATVREFEGKALDAMMANADQQLKDGNMTKEQHDKVRWAVRAEEKSKKDYWDVIGRGLEKLVPKEEDSLSSGSPTVINAPRTFQDGPPLEGTAARAAEERVFDPAKKRELNVTNGDDGKVGGGGVHGRKHFYDATVELDRYPARTSDSSDRNRILKFSKFFKAVTLKDHYPEIYTEWERHVQEYSKLETSEARAQYLDELGRRILTKIMEANGTDRIGLHFNRSARSDLEYVNSGGLVEVDNVVYFMRVSIDPSTGQADRSLHDILKPQSMPLADGGVVILFDLKGQNIQEALSASAVRDSGFTSLRMKEPAWFQSRSWGKKKPISGLSGARQRVLVPHEEYLTIPLLFDPARHYQRSGGNIAETPFSKAESPASPEGLMARMLYIGHMAMNYGLPDSLKKVEPPSTGERRARERGVARPEEVQVPLREKLARAVESQEKETSIALLKEMGYDGSAIYALTEKHHKVRSLGIINDIVRLPPSMTPLFLKLQEKYPQTAFDQFESLARLYELSQQTGKTVPEEQWLRLADEFAEGDVRAAAANSLGAVTRRSALEATIHRLQLLDKAFDVQRDSLKHRDEVYRTWRVGDQYELSLHRGQLESSAGLELRLYKKGEEPILLGRVGFQMTDAAIEIVHYQGGRLREAANPLRDGFKDFSGGVGPMEWLAFVTGRFLLDASKSLNTELRFLDGQWVPGCYPHPPGSLTPGMHSIKEAKAYPWKSASLPTWLQKLRDSLPALRSELENPSEPEFMTEPIDKWRARQQWKIDGIERALAMHQEGPRTIEHYQAIAGKLGFKRKTRKQPWLRFTKAPEDFGKAVRKTSSNPAAFDASVRNVIKAIETSSKPTPEKIVESVEKVYPQAAEPVGFFGKIAEGSLRGALAVIRGWFGGSEARTDGNRILEQMYNEGKLTLEREADKDNGILQAKLEHILESEGIRSFEDYVQFLHSEAAKAQPINVQIGERGEVKVIIDGNTRMLGAMEMGIDPKDIPVLYGDFPMDAQHIQPNTTLDVVLQIAQSRTAE